MQGFKKHLWDYACFIKIIHKTIQFRVHIVLKPLNLQEYTFLPQKYTFRTFGIHFLVLIGYPPLDILKSIKIKTQVWLTKYAYTSVLCHNTTKLCYGSTWIIGYHNAQFWPRQTLANHWKYFTQNCNEKCLLIPTTHDITHDMEQALGTSTPSSPKPHLEKIGAWNATINTTSKKRLQHLYLHLKACFTSQKRFVLY